MGAGDWNLSFARDEEGFLLSETHRMNLISWERYKNYLRTVHDGALHQGSHRRIALIGIPLLEHGEHPLKTALTQWLDQHEEWHVTFMSDAYLESYQTLAKIPCDGILARVVSEKMAREARKLSCPLVNISGLLKDPGVQTVRRDDRQRGELCAAHLLEKGFSNIGIVSTFPNKAWSGKETLKGFTEYIRKHGNKINILTHQIDIALSEANMMSQLRKWLKSLALPCALFGMDDRTAIAVMKACREAGLSVPREIAVISTMLTPKMIDGSEMTLTHPLEDGSWLIGPACERLKSLMENPDQPVQNITIPCPGLVQGESTDTLAVSDPMVREAIDFIEECFREGINVSDVVRQGKVSRRTLERRFASAVGISIHDYIGKTCIKAAVSMIKNSTSTLEDVAEQSGFLSYKAFKNTLLREEGMSPGAWRSALSQKG